VLLIAGFSGCAGAENEPEKVIRQYFAALQKGDFAEKYWNMEEFVKIYYGQYWENAPANQRETLVKLVNQFADMTAKLQQRFAENSEINKITILNETPEQRIMKVEFMNKENPKITLDITFMLRKEQDRWKIINYERIGYKGGDFDLVETFQKNMPSLLKDAGYETKNIDLETINKFIKEKLLTPEKEQK
jgi:hypothetical protein